MEISQKIPDPSLLRRTPFPTRKADQGPSAQTRATKARQPLDPEISIIDSNPPKKTRWDVSKCSTTTDHEDVLDTEASASDDVTSAARWAASEELFSFLEVVARKPLTNFERKSMSREYPRPSVDAVYTPELDDYIATLVQGARAIAKDNRFLQDKVLDITGALCMMFEHLTAMSNSSSTTDLALSQDQVQSLLQAVSYSIRLIEASKTDPFRQGVRLFLPRTGGALCPVASISAYLHRRGNSSGPLFLFTGGKPLSCLHVTDRLRSILEAGIQGNFSSHSFRIGAATSAHAAGLPDSLIRTLGRWSSDAYLVYVRTSLDTLHQAARQLASSSP